MQFTACYCKHMQHIRYDVIIAGAGLVGSALALGLAQAGIRVAVVDPLPKEAQLNADFDGRVSAIAIASTRILDAIGVWEHAKAHAEPIFDIRVLDGDSSLYVHFDHREVGTEPFGYMLENQRLRSALFVALSSQDGATFIAGDSVESYVVEGACVKAQLASGTTLEGSLIVAADGRLSSLRSQTGLPHRVVEYGQTAIVCTVAHSNPHHGVALERFLPSGPFAVLPMTQQRSCIVWTEKTEYAPHILALSDEQFNEELAKRMGAYWGTPEVVGKRHAYPLRLMFAKEMVAERFALIGDAAHGIHPIAGQGVNLGYRDVAAMVELLGKHHALGLDIGESDILERYARWRRGDSVSMTAFTDILDRLFSNDIPGIRLARRLGLGIVNRTPMLKKRLMMRAMGVAGNVPEMLRPKAS